MDTYSCHLQEKKMPFEQLKYTVIEGYGLQQHCLRCSGILMPKGKKIKGLKCKILKSSGVIDAKKPNFNKSLTRSFSTSIGFPVAQTP